MSRLTEKILKNIADYPQRTVLVDTADSTSYTYAEFFDAARKIAARLINQGVAPDSFVTIELPRTKEYVAAMFGVWLAGAAFVALSPTYPEDRLAYIREDCRAAAVINERFLRGIKNEKPLENIAAAEDNSPALLIYTSGSTGKPKGVLHTHLGISDSVVRYAEYIKSPVGFRSALGAPFTFVASVQGVFEPLYSSLTAYLMPYQAMRDPVLLADFIEEYQINRVFISPKMLRVFKQKGSSLKIVFTGSERVSKIYSDEFKTIVSYGQTESAGAVLMFEIDREYDNTPVGKPIGNIITHILDENNSPADEGELCLAGNFTSGYINMEEATAKTLIDNPFAEQDGFPKLLRTGDLVRKNECGNIIFINRKDWMVKINGQRVEPGEIEAVIKNLDGIGDAVIKDFKNQYGQVYLTAYYVENEPVDVQNLKRTMAEQLPSYMIPSFFVRLDKLPVNANGKLDRSALEAPDAGSFKSEYIAPETDVQKDICAAFEKVLGVENAGIDDDFFALGGDSIKCAMVITECPLYKITTADIFAGKTPRGIERLMLVNASKRSAVRKKKKVKSYPLNPLERGMYIEQKMNPDSTVYNLNISAFFRGTDADSLCNSLRAVFAAHEAFHSFYGEESGLPVRILSDRLPDIQIEKADDKEAVKRIADSEKEPFNLNENIPVRATVYELSDGSAALLVQVHHIAFDGGSAKTFFNELISGLKGSLAEPAEIDLADLYSDSVEEQYESGMDFYREMFSDGIPVNEMPVRGKRPKEHPLSDRELSFAFSADEVKALDLIARRRSVTEFELIFSAVSMALAKYTASQDVVLGIPTNMRPADAENVIGMFVNTAPVRVKPARELDINEYLKSAADAVRSATYGAYLPFEDVVAEFVKQRDKSRNPIFDVSLNYMWNPPAYDDGELSVEMYAPLQKMGRDIGIVVRKTEDGLRFVFQYSSILFEDTVVQNFAEQIQHTIGLLGKENTRTVRDALELPENQTELLEKFSESAAGGSRGVLLHGLFEKTAEENPDKTALISVDAQYTYRELNEKANAAAHHLIDMGVKKGDSVALLLPRESCFFVCMFGVNKAGASFIPCDPQYPADRINYIVEDSGASYIITTADKLGDYPPEKAIDVNTLLSGGDTSNPNVEMSGDELAYMIYTSGSTGKPKGVMLRHSGICNYLEPHPANIHIYAVKEKVENYLSVTTVSFDMSFKEHATALCNGKTLVFAGEQQMNDPITLTELMKKYHIDCINATPSRLLQYMEYKPFANAIADCKVIMSGGEAYSMALKNKISEAAPNAEIFNTYGPTEITVSSNAALLNGADEITIGRPLYNYKEYIVDKYGDPAPFGVIGELYIGGAGVAEGYRNLPEKTAEAFIEYNGRRMYRSGDYAKWDDKGFVHILGRLDNQVKLRGLRIELGEIEGLIAKQPHIKSTAVVIRKLNGQDNLCAYYTADTEIDFDDLRNELKKELTPYMIPTAYLQLDEMPQTANGKTDIRALPEPVPVSLGEYSAPQNETEEFFCEVFRNILKIDRVGATDDFFEIGGTSLSVTSVVVAASEKGYDITYGDVFKYTTPRALAEVFGKGEKIGSASVFDFDDYDYSRINALLKNNNIDSFVSGEAYTLGNVMITGAIGYMGAHLLARFLETENGRAYCMIRKGKYRSAADRLKNMMFYYFGSRFEEDIKNRVEVFNGDVTDYSFFEPMETLPIKTVFNCAANVKHFSNGTDIEDINVGGAVNCIKLCKKLNARLIHFSTVSVSGTARAGDELSKKILDEQTFYFGQNLDNKYISSKLMSEREVLESVADGSLDGKVIRVGTLAARESDGEFQINFLTNNFMGRLRSYALLGCFPYQMIENQVCMGPIDTSCDAFLRLAKTPAACCLFNAVNNHTLPLGDIIRQMNSSGMLIEFVDASQFAERLNEAQKDPKKAAILSSMTAYMNTAHGVKVAAIPFSAHYTTQVLARTGFFWNASNERYVNDFINALKGFRFFNKKNMNR